MTDTDNHKALKGTVTISRRRLLQLLSEEVALDAKAAFDEERCISIDTDAVWSGSLIEEIHPHVDGTLEIDYSSFYYHLTGE